jgi:catechol 2,3-dioxygenase-like lactoylglutathione lyase family enzyme
MKVLGIHHFTLRCRPSELETLRDFYSQVLGMRPGPRPAFDFPGHWLYVGEAAVVHLAAIVPEDASAAPATGGGFDHVALHCTGLEATRARVEALGLPFEELPVPGWPLRQIFLKDPAGSKIELTFDANA